MELKLNSGDTITIPDGCRAVIKDKIITVEKEIQEFKDGDFLYYHEKEWGFGVCILKYLTKEWPNEIFYYAATSGSGKIMIDNYLSSDWDELRLATEEEKKWLLDKLHAEGKDWDAENKKIVEYRWKPKDGEDYYVINTLFKVLRFTWQGYCYDFDLLKIGNCFKTEEDAKAKADEIIKILNK